MRISLKPILRWMVVAAAGLGQAASIANPWDGEPLWWLQIFSLAALCWRLNDWRPSTGEKVPWGAAMFHGWSFAVAWLCGTFWWLFISMHTYGGLAAPLAAAAVLGLAAALAIYYAIACAVFVGLARVSRRGAPFLFAAIWTLAELLRGALFTGFPWGAGGYAHVEGPLSQAAPWVGVHGVGAFAALAAALLAWTARAMLLRSPRDVYAALAITMLVLSVPSVLGALLGGGGGTRTSGKLSVALLQGNIPQDEKFVPGGGVVVALQWYAEQLRNAKASLTITPETAIPLSPSQLPPGYLEAIASRFSTGGQAVVLGLPMAAGATYSNALLGFRPDGAAPYRYDKHHLVPFGEFVPPMFRWFTELMSIPLGDLERGAQRQSAFAWQGQRIAPNICFEDLFGDEIGAAFRDDATAPTILLNASNIAWFGDSIAIDQHRTISRMRALEFARPIIRATNTGATVSIDHLGRVMAELPRLTRGVLSTEIEGRRGRTPYARWVSTAGHGPLWMAMLAMAAPAFLLAVSRTGRKR